jgi:hypothetical protein
VAIEGRDRGLEPIVGLHLDETEATRPTGFTVGDHLGGAHGTVRRKHLLQIGGRGGPRQVPHVNLPGHKNNL